MILSPTLQKMPPLQDENSYKAAIIESPKKVKVESFLMPKPGKDEVRIKIEGCGISESNLPVWEGSQGLSYPINKGMPGDEAWGLIDAVGENVSNFTRGERVTGYCTNSFATHDIAKPENLIYLPDFLDGKPFPGKPLGIAMEIFSRSDIRKGQTVAFVGCGFLEFLLIQLAKSTGANVIALSNREFSLDMAKKAGADHTMELDDHFKTIEKIKKITEGKLCDRVIDAIEEEEPGKLSIELIREGGKLIYTGFPKDVIQSEDSPSSNGKKINFIRIDKEKPENYIQSVKDAIDAIQKQDFDPFQFFTHAFSLEEMEEVYTFLKEQPDGYVKGLIINNQPI